MNLPYFSFSADGMDYDAHRNHTLSKVYNETSDKIYGFYVDNQWLKTGVNVIYAEISTSNPVPVLTLTLNNTNKIFINKI